MAARCKQGLRHAGAALRGWRTPHPLLSRTSAQNGALAPPIDCTQPAGVLQKRWAEHDLQLWWPTSAASILVSESLVRRLLLVYVLYASAVVVLARLFAVNLDLESDVTIGLGTLMALLLAFRINISYNRWWEGRLLWGNITMTSRSVVSALLSLSDPREEIKLSDDPLAQHITDIIGLLIAFINLLRIHLRSEKVETLLAGQNIQRLLDSRVLERMSASKHPPLHALRQLRLAGARVCKARREAAHDAFSVLALEQFLLAQSGVLYSSLQGCERLARTPCAPGYVAVLRCAIFAFIGVLPFLVLELGVGSIFISTITAFVLFGAEDLAVQLEVPFGLDANDLPLETYCLTLEADLLAQLEESLNERRDLPLPSPSESCAQKGETLE
ncbi:hypothetical protein AB1Y20_007482 [Prymnesium parvum]|uniref:Bestrophin homolog n=1 Tax=Prymnesium parvum TaxID=97485 RepID=A0AB34IYY5_PRYPA